MLKQSRPEVKKTLVRNTSGTTVGKSVTVVAPSIKPSTLKGQSTLKTSLLSSEISKLSLESNSYSNKAFKASSQSLQPTKPITSKTRFNTPNLQSTLKLSKQIDEVVKPRRTKSTSDVEANKLAMDEKVNRKVNLPLYKPVFKDLIPITNYEPKTQIVIPPRPPKPLKDPEPKLEDFLESKQVKNYVSVPKLNVRSVISQSGVIKDPPCRHLRLYSLLQVHNETKAAANFSNGQECNSNDLDLDER